MKIILIGFMGSGKSSTAKLLAKQLHMSLLDTDELVIKKTDTKNISEVFSKGGELLLRKTEIEIAKEYATANNFVIATGGGAVLNKIILDYLKQPKDHVIFLNASFETLAQRLANNSGRPLFKNVLQAKSLYDLRLPLYSFYADLTVETNNKCPQEVAETIIQSLALKTPT